jgi:hypothetical protein
MVKYDHDLAIFSKIIKGLHEILFTEIGREKIARTTSTLFS